MTATPEELGLLRDTARAWVAQQAAAQPGHQRDVGEAQARWAAMAEMGWAGAAVDDAHGGAGMGLAAIGVLLAELGRELVDAPLLASGLLATQALWGAKHQAALLARVAAGTSRIAVALDEGAHHAPHMIDTRATRGASGWTLHGTKRYVLHAAEADHLIVSARDDEGPGLFLVDRTPCTVTPLDTMDGRSCAHVALNGVPAAARLGGADAIDRLASLARVGMASELLGAAERMLERIVDYLKTREQFGRLIGSFQALQHRAAQMLVAIEVARCAVDEAWAAADRDDPQWPALALVAKYTAGEAAHLASNEMVQMHGGIGMTTEHVAGRYLKWTRTSERYYGDAGWLADRYATLNGY